MSARYFQDNLGLATDLLLHRETGLVESQGGYIVVRTPGTSFIEA